MNRLHDSVQFRTPRFLSSRFAVFVDEPVDDGKSGKGGGDAPKTFTQAEVDALTSGLKSKNTELLGKVKDLNGRAIPEGMTLDEVNEAITEKRKAAEKRALDEGNFEAARLAIKKEADAETAKERAARETAEGKYKNTLKKADAINAIVAEKGNATLLLPHVLNNLDVVDQNGEDTVVVVDSVHRKPVLGGDGRPMTVQQFIASLKTKDEYLGAFAAPNVGGSGARGGAGAADGAGNLIVTKTTTHAEYRRIKEDAQKRGVGITFAD